MKHFLTKKKYTLIGNGGSAPPAPPAPITTIYPNVLVPPSNGELQTINSFSYAEMIDLISDGPIEGIVNVNGAKVYEENIFEGIYLNDTQIKESSSLNVKKLNISWIASELKKVWYEKKIFSSDVSKFHIVNQQQNTGIGDEFKSPSDIKIYTFTPESSILNFVNLINGDLDSIPLIKRAFENRPIAKEIPFLTVVEIPKLSFSLESAVFDIKEGGASQNYPLKLRILNFSDFIYFSVDSNSLGDFNYFEIPRSFVFNNLTTASGKRTFYKNIKSSQNRFTNFDAYNIRIFIWSVFDTELNEPIFINDEVFKRYLRYLFVYQNTPSLYNFNLVQSEFRNGSQFQTPLEGFSKAEVDNDLGKELVGPYKLSNDFDPRSSSSAGGVQRLTQFNFNYKSTIPVNVSIDNETSDDIRYSKVWAAETTQKNEQYLICNFQTNFAQFDKTSSVRVSQEAVPVTHYISNNNVECIYVTLALTQLSDTTHVDLASPAAGVRTKKWELADPVFPGFPTYACLPGSQNSNIVDNICCGYILLYGTNESNGYVIDFGCAPPLLNETETPIQAIKREAFCNLINLTAGATSTIWNEYIQCLGTKINNLSSFVNVGKYIANESNRLVDFMLPSRFGGYIEMPSFKIQEYFSATTLTAKLKTNSDENLRIYPQGLNDNEQIIDKKDKTLTLESNDGVPTQAITLINNIKNNPQNNGFYPMLLTYQFSSIQTKDNILRGFISAVKINNLINYNLLFKENLNSMIYASRPAPFIIPSFGVTTQPTTSTASVLISEIKFPNIWKYIVSKILLSSKLTFFANSLQYSGVPRYRRTFNLYATQYPPPPPNTILLPSYYPPDNYDFYTDALNNSITDRNGNIYHLLETVGEIVLLGWTENLLRSKTEYFKDGFLTLEALEFLLDEYAFKNDFDSSFFDERSTDTNLIKTFENNIKRIENGRLIGSSEVYKVVRSLNKTNDYYDLLQIDANPVSETIYNITNSSFDTYTDDVFTYATNKTIMYPTEKTSLDLHYVYFLRQPVDRSQVRDTTNLSPTYRFIPKNDKGEDQPEIAAPALANALRTVNAGTKIPTVVSVKVETGYESSETRSYFGPNEYFAYQFDIFGIVNSQTMIDIGRNAYDFVKMTKRSNDGGTLLNFNQTVNYQNLELMLYEVDFVFDGVQQPIGSQLTTGPSEKFSNYFLTNKPFELIEGWNLDRKLFYRSNDANNIISFITQAGYTIGNEFKIGQSFKNNLKNLVNEFLSQNNNYSLLNYQITKNDYAAFFNDADKVFYIQDAVQPEAQDRLKIYSNKMISPFASIINSLVSPKSNIKNNPNNYDIIRWKFDASTYIEVKIYNYLFTTIENINVERNNKFFTTIKDGFKNPNIACKVFKVFYEKAYTYKKLSVMFPHAYIYQFTKYEKISAPVTASNALKNILNRRTIDLANQDFFYLNENLNRITEKQQISSFSEYVPVTYFLVFVQMNREGATVEHATNAAFEKAETDAAIKIRDLPANKFNIPL